MKYYALEIGTGRVCSNTTQQIIDAYGCIVYEGSDIEIIKTLIEQPESDFPMPPSYIISYNPTHANFEQYQSAAVRHAVLHGMSDKVADIQAATTINQIDNILGL